MNKWTTVLVICLCTLMGINGFLLYGTWQLNEAAKEVISEINGLDTGWYCKGADCTFVKKGRRTPRGPGDWEWNCGDSLCPETPDMYCPDPDCVKEALLKLKGLFPGYTFEGWHHESEGLEGPPNLYIDGSIDNEEIYFDLKGD